LNETGKYPVNVGTAFEIERPQDRSEDWELCFWPLFKNGPDAKSGGQFESDDAPRLRLGRPTKFPAMRHHDACARFAQFVGKQPMSLPGTGPTTDGDVFIHRLCG
jgi:hypothetical protein